MMMDDYDSDFEYEDELDYWEPSMVSIPSDVEHAITGALRDRVLARVGITNGTVTITEHYWDSGYCGTCSSLEIDFIVKVDGDEVYNTDENYYYSDYSIEGLKNYSKFNDWLNGTDDE